MGIENSRPGNVEQTLTQTLRGIEDACNMCEAPWGERGAKTHVLSLTFLCLTPGERLFPAAIHRVALRLRSQPAPTASALSAQHKDSLYQGENSP